MTEEQKKRLLELKKIQTKNNEELKEFDELLILERREKIKKHEKIYSQFETKTVSIDEKNYTVEAIASTNSIDRHGDIVEQDSWELAKFKKNPVILADHDYRVEKIIGKAISIEVKDGKLQMKVKFAVDESELAKTTFKLIKGGFLSAWSVGFIPKEYEEFKNENERGYLLKKCELLEVSAVAVPSNADCLTNAVKSGTIEEQEAEIMRRNFGEDFRKKELELIEKQKKETALKNKEILKKYRKTFKKINEVLGMTPTGNEQKDIDDMVKMLVFCLGLDNQEEKTENKKEFIKKSKISTQTNFESKKAKPATQKDIEDLKKFLIN